MKKTHQIKINDTDITLKFGFGFLALLGQKWNCAGPVAVMQYFAVAISGFINALDAQGITDVFSAENAVKTLPADTNIDIPFNTLTALSDVVIAAAEAQKCDTIPDADDVQEWMMDNPHEMQAIVTLFMQSMPKPREAEKKQTGTATSPEPIQNP